MCRNTNKVHCNLFATPITIKTNKQQIIGVCPRTEFNFIITVVFDDKMTVDKRNMTICSSIITIPLCYQDLCHKKYFIIVGNGLLSE